MLSALFYAACNIGLFLVRFDLSSANSHHIVVSLDTPIPIIVDVNIEAPRIVTPFFWLYTMSARGFYTFSSIVFYYIIDNKIYINIE